MTFFLSCKLNWGLNACVADALLPGVGGAIAGKPARGGRSCYYCIMHRSNHKHLQDFYCYIMNDIKCFREVLNYYYIGKLEHFCILTLLVHSQ